MKTMLKRTGAILAAGVLLSSASGRQSTPPYHLNHTLEAFLKDPFVHLERQGLTRQDFQNNTIAAEHVNIALSNLAEGCTNIGISDPQLYEEAKDCVATALMVALHPQLSPYDVPVQNVTDFGENGLYLSHLNIILGSWKSLTHDDSYGALNKKITEHLAQQTLQDPQKNIHSYPTLNYKWPADQTAVLYSLWLFDKNYGTEISKKPISEWMNYMDEKKTDKKTGLYVSEVTGEYPGADVPRGCAISWSIRYMAAFAPEKAAEQWEFYKQNFEQQYWPLAAFREWPVNYYGFSDVDSGPILAGNGVAATAFAIGTSRALGDEETYAQLQRTETVARFTAYTLARVGNDEGREIRSIAESLLASAIDLNMHTITKR